jgi:hypothetical protein
MWRSSEPINAPIGMTSDASHKPIWVLENEGGNLKWKFGIITTSLKGFVECKEGRDVGFYFSVQ